MPLRLSEHADGDRPRERFWALGPAALTGQELLAILLGTGSAGRDALSVAGELLARGEGALRRLAGRPAGEGLGVGGGCGAKGWRCGGARRCRAGGGGPSGPPPPRG